MFTNIQTLQIYRLYKYTDFAFIAKENRSPYKISA